MPITMLEYALAGTGLVTLLLALWALYDSTLERLTLTRAGVNGLRWATVNGHLSRDVARVIAALVLAVAGIWLLLLPNESGPASLVAKHALLSLGLLLSFSVFADRVMRQRVRWHLDREVS